MFNIRPIKYTNTCAQLDVIDTGKTVLLYIPPIYSGSQDLKETSDFIQLTCEKFKPRCFKSIIIVSDALSET